MIPAASLEASPTPTVDRIFNQLAVLYDPFYGPFLDKLRREGVRLLDIESGMRVLEVGIGTGLSLELYPKGIDFVGIDPSANMLAKARQRVDELGLEKVELVEIGAEELDFPDASFDRVLVSSVLSVVPHPVKALNQVARVTRPGGLACAVAHFAGRTRFHRTLDFFLGPFTTRFLGYRMNTPRSIVEDNPDWEVVDQRELGSHNFSTAYLLRRTDSN